MSFVISQIPVLQIDSFDLLAIVILLVVLGVAIGLYLWWIGWAIFTKPLTGAEALLGKQGIAVTELTQEEGGKVTVDGIIWKASLSPEADKTISKGEPVVVVRVSSLTLIVERFAKRTSEN
ncbi:MAG: NfeD family protein [Nitrososphaerales archaeon]